jgi:hypothetical protein
VVMQWSWRLVCLRENAVAQASRKFKRKRGDDSEWRRHGGEGSVATENVEAKVERMQQLEADAPDKLTEGARTFCSWTLGPAMVYLRQHRRFVTIVEAKFK